MRRGRAEEGHTLEVDLPPSSCPTLFPSRFLTPRLLLGSPSGETWGPGDQGVGMLLGGAKGL